MSLFPVRDHVFKVPSGLDVISKRRLQKTPLLAFYSLNEDDFLAVVAIRYSEVIADPDPGAVTDPVHGFNSFCDLMTAYFLAAPSERLVSAKDDKGQYVNFFGEAIVDHLENSNLTSQQLYAYDGSQKFAEIWLLVNIFIRYVAIESFRIMASKLKPSHIAKARSRIKEVQEGRRALKYVPAVPRKFVGQ